MLLVTIIFKVGLTEISWRHSFWARYHEGHDPRHTIFAKLMTSNLLKQNWISFNRKVFGGPNGSKTKNETTTTTKLR